MLNTTRAQRRIPRVSVLAVIAIAVSACSGGSDGDPDDNQIASLEVDDAGSGSAADASDDESEAAVDGDPERTFDDAALDFAACMRGQGIDDWPDPAPGGNEGGRPFGDVDFQALGIEPGSSDFQATLDVCRAEFEGVAAGREGLTPEEEAERLDQQIALAECVRQSPGWEDFPDPDPSGDGFQELRELFQSGEFDIDEFRPIQQECAAELGLEGLPGGAGRGPGTGGGEG